MIEGRRVAIEVELTVKVELVKGARGVRRTFIRRVADGMLLAEVLTEWVWVRLSDGRPTAAPRELVDLAAGVTEAIRVGRPARSTSRRTRSASSPVMSPHSRDMAAAIDRPAPTASPCSHSL